MNERQKWFCRHYLDTLVGSEAVRLAGYKAKNEAGRAYDLLQLPYIQNYLMKLLKENERDLELDCQRNFKKLFLDFQVADDYYAKIEKYRKIKSLIKFMEEL